MNHNNKKKGKSCASEVLTAPIGAQTRGLESLENKVLQKPDEEEEEEEKYNGENDEDDDSDNEDDAEEGATREAAAMSLSIKLRLETV